MKFDIKILFDNEWFIGYSPGLLGCYVQDTSEMKVKKLIEKAIKIYIENYSQRYEPLIPEEEAPQINMKIKYTQISSEQLATILKKLGYNLEFGNDEFLLFRKKDFPFYRLLIPNVERISHQIILHIFGAKNVMHLADKKLYHQVSGQA